MARDGNSLQICSHAQTLRWQINACGSPHVQGETEWGLESLISFLLCLQRFLIGSSWESWDNCYWWPLCVVQKKGRRGSDLQCLAKLGYCLKVRKSLSNWLHTWWANLQQEECSCKWSSLLFLPWQNKDVIGLRRRWVLNAKWYVDALFAARLQLNFFGLQVFCVNIFLLYLVEVIAMWL